MVALGLLGAALAGLTARSDLARASGQARQAIDAVNGGDYQTASVRFDDASRAFESADQRLGGLLTLPALAIPGVSQNIAAGTDISAAAAKAASEAAIALESVDPGALTVVDGSIDIDAIRAVEEPLRRVEAALADLRVVTDSVDSPWLLGPFQTRLAELDNEFGTSQVRLGTAIDAVRLAPRMLGADESRRYLVLFTTPAEVRGIAGFIGNYATVEVDDGKIRVAEFGRRSDLDTYLGVNPAFCDGCRQDVLDRYGIFGLDIGPEGGVIPTVWLNLTMPASFPNVAETAQILYPQSGGEPIDGVIVVDPYVIEALMEYTGPIAVPELDVTVTADNAAEFILRDQYVLAGDDAIGGIDNESRIDALQTLGEAVIQRLLSGALPEPSQLARDLGPLATEHRLMMWTDDELEQQLLDEAGLLGAMPELGDDGGFGVVVANTGESKIDVFLERDTDVRIETTPGGAAATRSRGDAAQQRAQQRATALHDRQRLRPPNWIEQAQGQLLRSADADVSHPRRCGRSGRVAAGSRLDGLLDRRRDRCGGPGRLRAAIRPPAADRGRLRGSCGMGSTTRQPRWVTGQSRSVVGAGSAAAALLQRHQFAL